MRISTKGRYALRLMIDLAEHDTDSYVALKDIAMRQEISIKYLEQIIAQLNHAGLVKSSRGPQGGYRLMKNPQEYAVADILRVTEGKLALADCLLEDERNLCARSEICPTIGLWEELQEQIDHYLNSVSLQDLLNKQKQKKAALEIGAIQQ